MSAECLEFLQACLVYDTQSRPSVRQLQQHPFISKVRSQASLRHLESEFDSNPHEEKAGFGWFPQPQSFANLKFERQHSNELPADLPEDALRRKPSGWAKSSKDVKVAPPNKKRDPLPYQVVSSVQTSDNLHHPEHKKKSRIAEDARDREPSSPEPIEADKPRPVRASPRPLEDRPLPQIAPSKFVITALQPEGLVRNPSAWQANRLLLADSTELQPDAEPERPLRIDVSHQSSERVVARPDERRTGQGPTPATGLEQPPGDAAARSKQLLDEVEAAQQLLLEELLQPGPGQAQPQQEPASLGLSAIEREQQLLLEELLQGSPDRLPTVVSQLDSPERQPAKVNLSQIEAEQMQLLAELMGDDGPASPRPGQTTTVAGPLDGTAAPADRSFE